MKTITLTNLQALLAQKSIESIKLDGQKSFARRRFLREIKFIVSDLEAERKELLTKYAEKKGDELKIDNKQYVFTAKNRKQYDREFDKLNEFEASIDVTDSNSKDIATVAEILGEEIVKIEKENADGTNADTYEYITYLKEIEKILKNE